MYKRLPAKAWNQKEPQRVNQSPSVSAVVFSTTQYQCAVASITIVVPSAMVLDKSVPLFQPQSVSCYKVSDMSVLEKSVQICCIHDISLIYCMTPDKSVNYKIKCCI